MNPFFKNIKNDFIVAGCIIAILLFMIFISTCNGYKKRAEDLNAINIFYKAKVDSFKSHSGHEVYTAPVAQTNSADDVKKISAKYFDLKKSDERKIKKLQTFITANQKFIVHDTIAAYVNAPADSSMSDTPAILLPPKYFALTTPFYLIAGKTTPLGVRINDMEIYNDISLRIGEQKRGWFRGSILTVQATNSNPYIHTDALNSITVKQHPNAWQRWIKPALTAGLASYFTYKFIR